MIDKTSNYITCIYFMYCHLIAWTVIILSFLGMDNSVLSLYRILSPYVINSSCNLNFRDTQCI